MYRKTILLILIFVTFGSIHGQNSKLDSLKFVIQKTTDSLFFNDWAFSIHDKPGFGKFQKEEMVEWFIKRTGELNLPVEQAHFIYRKSIQKTINGDYDAALKYIEEAIPVFEKHETYILLSACYNSKGSILATIGNINGAIQNLEKAIQLMEYVDLEPKKKLKGMANHYNVLGTIYGRSDQLEKSIENYEIAYELAKKSTPENSKERCFCLLNLSHGKLKMKEFEKALVYAEMSVRQSKLGKYNDTYCMGLQRLGLAHSGLNNKDSALYYYNQMEKIAFKYKYNHYLYQAYKAQALHFEKHGEYKLALEKHKLFSKLVIEREKEKKKALSNHLVFETEKRDKEKAEFELAKTIQVEKEKQKNLKILLFSILGLLSILGVFLYSRYQSKKLKQKLKDKKNQIELMQSQIRTIGSQMNPHFVFNALNSVQDLILQKDVRGSSIYLAKFAELMRITLENSQVNTVSLEKEIEVLELYLDLESLRFDDDFSFSIEKRELHGERYEIPAMLLQPYVENAVKHGLLHKEGRKTLKIVFREKRGNLQCVIEDNGIGRAKSAEINKRRKLQHKSFALQANERRLELINKTTNKTTTLKIEDLMEGDSASGTRVIFTFM